MISTLLATAVLLAAPPKEAQMKIVGASMFKNGYVVVLREMDAPTSGEYMIKQIPQGSLGTLWITASEGTKLKEVVNSINDGPDTSFDFAALDQILSANKGKQLEIEIPDVGDKRKFVTGKLLTASAEMLLMESEGQQFTIRRPDVISIRSREKLVYSGTIKTKFRGLRFVVDSEKPGKVFMISLERGATWAPAFALDISDPKKLVLTSKATVINDLEDMEGVDFRFVTGFPNIRFADIVDPLVMNTNADQFIGAISGTGGFGGGMGGPGGGGGRAGEMMNQKAALPMTADAMAAAMDMDGEGVQAGDLFFYTKSNMTLKKSERGMYMLFQSSGPYKEIYSWIVQDETSDNVEYRFPSADPGEVWHSIRFRNTSGQPLTTAAATTMKDGQILGQDMLSYTPAGAEAEVKITKALDIRVEKSEEEMKREPGAVKEKYVVGSNSRGEPTYAERPLYDRLFVKGTLVIRNQKKEAVTIKVAKTLTGEVVQVSNSANVIKLAKGIRDINPTSQITWQIDVAPGKTQNLTYQFSMLVKAQRG